MTTPTPTFAEALLAIIVGHFQMLDDDRAVERAKSLIVNASPELRAALEPKREGEKTTDVPSGYWRSRAVVAETRAEQVERERDDWKAKYMSGADLRQLLCQAEHNCATWKASAEKAEALWALVSKAIQSAAGGGA